MKSLMFVLIITCSLQSFAVCISGNDAPAADKKRISEVMSRLAGGVGAWTEVKKGTAVLETKNTIRVNINFAAPFSSSFRAGTKTESINQICEMGSAIVIKTGKGNATIRRSGDRLLIQTFIGTYQVLPASKVRAQKSEAIPIPKYYQEVLPPTSVSA